MLVRDLSVKRFSSLQVVDEILGFEGFSPWWKLYFSEK